MLKSLKESHSLIDSLQSESHLQAIKASGVDSELSEFKVKLRTAGMIGAQLEACRLEYENSERRSVDWVESLAGEVAGCKEEVGRLGREKAEGLRREGEMEVRVERMEGEVGRLGRENLRLESENSSMGSQLKLAGTEGNILMAVRAQKDCILADLQRTKNQNSNFSAQIEQLQSEIKKSAKARLDDVSSQHQEISAMLEKVQRSELQCNSLRAEKNSLKKENTDYKNHIGSLESLLCVKEDVYAQLQSS